MLISTLLPTTVGGFLLFGVTDEVSLRLHLYDKLIDITPEGYYPIYDDEN